MVGAYQHTLMAEFLLLRPTRLRTPIAFGDEALLSCMQGVMQDPVLCADGHTYERAAIIEWMSERGVSPLSGDLLESRNLIPNFTLRSIIEKLRENSL